MSFSDHFFSFSILTQPDTANTTMSKKVFKGNNGLASKNCEKLYLDSVTTDVNFVFRKDAVNVSAHKAILAAGSPVFHTMFYGSLPEKGDILIEDATAEAFKEFLQFFYLSKVQLSSQNIFQVANLCKKYEVNNGLKWCEAPMKQSLTIYNWCSTYAVASLLEMSNVIEYCEKEIKKNTAEVLKSDDFLECDQKVVDKILQLVSSKCSASVVVDACMAWTKAKCERKNLELTSANLKAQLKPFFHQIPFADLDSEQFSHHTKAYKQFFTEDELQAMLLNVMSSKEAKKHGTAPPLIELICDRELTTIFDCGLLGFAKKPQKCTFSSNTRILLTGLFITESVGVMDIPSSIQISTKGKVLASAIIMINPNKVTRITLSKSIIIDPNVEYDITFEITNLLGAYFKNCMLAYEVDMHDGIKIKFHSSGPSVIKRLVFQETVGY